ncbi:T9SS type A sorting domain-containing protein [Flavobacteriaceae bacterium]|jgi:hypothetical protein|nr:T9SS type A sorting domain-containing protein [Flavobacteriaceae bacterium]MDC1195549.1 T9SS type A sorting domain-containing protein [Flavobacteriaceae bacterium]
MNTKKTIITLVSLVLMGFGALQAQEALLSSGGDATGTGGTLAYSVGQLVTDEMSEPNKGSVALGLQHTFESITLSTSNFATAFGLKVFPNPVTQNLKLNIENYNNETLFAELFDTAGRSILKQKINANTTSFDVSNLRSASYILSVSKNGQQLKTYKIIKN